MVVDGRLDEAPWHAAALLTGFSEYTPVDGRPAEDSTRVLVWYSSTAIYFGICAFEATGEVHATLATRDHIQTDDWIEVLLDTFDDHREALVFGVNPLGVQADGILNETSAGTSDTVNLSPDFAYESKGRITEFGYEVEVRIPFKSLPYQPRDVQEWGLNVIRTVQRSGHVQTWTAARHAGGSFLAQSGALVGLSGLRRGLVLDVNPEVTGGVNGAPGASGWSYGRAATNLGGNLRWGISNGLTLSGTVRPDFSQVEADATQLTLDPRNALFYPEKRPFFLEGLERFDTPNDLIYTRRLLQPDVALKLTGEIAHVGIGFLSAVDDRAASVFGDDHPVYNLLRARTDLGGQSSAGLVYTEKHDGADWNRVAGADARVVVGGLYTIGAQVAESFTRAGGSTTQGPLWGVSIDRNGREFGFTYSLNAIDPQFVAGSGFIARTGIATGLISHHITLYGSPGATLESWTGGIQVDGTWDYAHLVGGDLPDDQNLRLSSAWVLRGWAVAAGVYLESFAYDRSLYANYAIQERVGGVADTVPFTGTPRIPNLDFVVQAQTPQYRHFDASLALIPAPQDENFYEWAPARVLIIEAGLDWRPSDRVRINATYLHQQYWRKSDGTTVARQLIPRFKVEYQLSRPWFVRAVAQYTSMWQDSLRDDSRTGDPILIRDPSTGRYTRAGAQSSNSLRVDALIAFTPSPGTVMYAGYGSSLAEPEPFAFGASRPVADNLFVKLTYLFHM